MAEQLGLNLDFSGRKVLVTGGASGIGKVTVKTFLNLNATLIVLDWDQGALEALKAEYPQVTTIHANIADWSGLEVALAAHHPIHHLVNNAGVAGGDTSLASVTEELYDFCMNVNLKGLVRMSQLVSRRMIEAKLEGATIVNISSTCSSGNSINYLMVYSASKAAVCAATRTMAHELAANKIRVNAVRPGACRTEMIEKMDSETRERIPMAMAKRQVYHPDLMNPQAIANTVVYLSSPVSEMVTGTSVTVDAGLELF